MKRQEPSSVAAQRGVFNNSGAMGMKIKSIFKILTLMWLVIMSVYAPPVLAAECVATFYDDSGRELYNYRASRESQVQ